MLETSFATEDVLQVLLERHSDLLPGDQIDPEAPRRWLLVSREVGVPREEEALGRWSLDHLFLDQDGIPTFVECKRSTDTRARREVVAQMLDYAANGTRYWSIDRLRQSAAETASRQQKSLDEQVSALLGGDSDADIAGFWQKVETNLRTGNVRLVFVADQIPQELRRLIEFLNEKMVGVEVLGVEIKQFTGQSQRALVPRVVGLTEFARETKSGKRTRPHVDRPTFLLNCEPGVAEFFEKLLDSAMHREWTIYWGEVGFSIRAQLKDGKVASFLYGYPKDKFEFYFKQLSLDDQQSARLRNELLAFRVFEEAGDWTLRTRLTEAVLPRMSEVLNFILNRVSNILSDEN